MYIHQKFWLHYSNICAHIESYHKQLLVTLQEIGFIYSINFEKNRFTSTISIVFTILLYENLSRDLREFLTRQIGIIMLGS